MASHYRRERIETFYHNLRVRQAVLRNQLEQPEFKSQKDVITGEIRALDLVLRELKEEFNIQDPDE